MSIGSSSTISKLMYCDDTQWMDFPSSPTASTCTKNGAITYSGGKIQYCNQTTLWDLDQNPTAGAACSKAGSLQFDSATKTMNFCDGTTTRIVQTNDTEPDAFDLTSTATGSEDRGSASTPITGTTGTTANVVFSNSSCTSLSIRTCADALCTTTISSRTSTGSLSILNGVILRAAGYSGPNENDTCSIAVTIGTKSSTFQIVTAADSTVSLGTISDSLGAAENAWVESNIFLANGFTGSQTVSISDMGLGGTPEFRVCADASCTSVTSPYSSSDRSITNPSYIQLRTMMGGSLSFRRVSVAGGSSLPSYWWASNATCPPRASFTPGSTSTCTCAAGYPLNMGQAIGTGNYRWDSMLCRTAVHAGRISQAAGGSITYRGTTAGSPSGTCPSFTGSTANGALTSNGTSGTSYYFSGSPDACN